MFALKRQLKLHEELTFKKSALMTSVKLLFSNFCQVYIFQIAASDKQNLFEFKNLIILRPTCFVHDERAYVLRS